MKNRLRYSVVVLIRQGFQLQIEEVGESSLVISGTQVPILLFVPRQSQFSPLITLILPLIFSNEVKLW